MSNTNKTFSIKNGIDVANTIIVDSSRNLTNVNAATVFANNGYLVAGTIVANSLNLNFVASNTSNLSITGTSNTNPGNVTITFDTRMPPGTGSGGASINVWSDAASIVTGVSNLTFNNTATTNAVLSANGSGANIGFSVNSSGFLDTTITGNCNVTNNITTSNLNVSSGLISLTDSSATVNGRLYYLQVDSVSGNLYLQSLNDSGSNVSNVIVVERQSGTSNVTYIHYGDPNDAAIGGGGPYHLFNGKMLPQVLGLQKYSQPSFYFNDTQQTNNGAGWVMIQNQVANSLILASFTSQGVYRGNNVLFVQRVVLDAHATAISNITIGNANDSPNVSIITSNLTVLGGTVAINASPTTNTITRPVTALSNFATASYSKLSNIASVLDSNLAVTINETGVYEIDCFLAFTATTGNANGFMGANVSMNGGTATIGSIIWSVSGWSNAATVIAANTVATNIASYGNVSTIATAPSWMQIQGLVTFSGTGTYGPMWSQKVSTVNNLTRMANSYIMLKKIG